MVVMNTDIEREAQRGGEKEVRKEDE